MAIVAGVMLDALYPCTNLTMVRVASSIGPLLPKRLKSVL